MEIKVFGSGCKNCKKMYENVKEACKELEVSADIIYVTDIVEIAKTGLMRTPGLMINQKMVLYGRVPSVDEVRAIIKKAM
ncbi:MAG: thioredoxin family protein [Bacilli bacterium]|nr:thioredoxin family protein [Bacilli bacterium]